MKYIMYFVYKTFRFAALRSNAAISNWLWKLWLKVGGEWADGILATGKLQKLPTHASLAGLEDVDLS